jgi:cysteine desulfurase/selenocysteine lyase
MPADRPDGDGAGGLDEIVKGALADALAGSEASPARLDTPPDAPLFAPRYAPLDPLAMVPFDLFGVAERGDWNLLPALMFPAPASVRGGPSGVPTPGLRRDFPALDQEVHGRRLVWLDNAATTQKPREVIDAISRFYETDNSNVHRGAHELAARATDAYERARATVQRYLGARSEKEIVFVRGTTEAINLVAQSWGRANVHAGDVIVVTHLEHHSNIVPWQLLCEDTGAVLRVVPVDDAGDVRLDAYEAMLSPRVKLVALPQVSNAIGTLVPVAAMAQMAHRHGALVLVDGAQSVAHMPVDVTGLGADFFVFSGHKIYGPTGIGVLYGREEVLEQMPPWQGGGSMIQDVTFERTTYARPPARFEAGTPSLADAVGLGVALDYVERAGRPAIAAHEQRLMSSLVAGLASVSGLSLVGAPAARVGAVSFVMAGHEPEAIGQYLNRRGIAVRAGHHCAQPILRRFGHETTVRPSLGIYNDESDIALLVRALRELAAGRRR